jgi:hypothetical protein
LSTPERATVERLAARIEDGATLARARDYSGCALAVVRRRPRWRSPVTLPRRTAITYMPMMPHIVVA